jgi:hypothetical protein
MATCQKLTVKDRIAALERETGRKITADERVGLQLGPEQYVCTGSGVGSLAGSKPKPKAKSRKRAPR